MNDAPQATLPAVEFDPRAFRNALGCFPTGVAIITTSDGDEPVGLTCNSFSSVSLDPPLVLWSLRTNSKSLPSFRKARAFAINILAEDQNLLSARFASSSIADKFEGVPWRRGARGVPLIDGCVARFECSTFAEHEAGDHVVFIGRVEQFEHPRQDDPLVFYRGAYMMVTRSLRELSAKGHIVPRDLDQARALVYGMLLPLACANGEEQDFDAIEALLREMEGLVESHQMARRAELAVRFFQLISAAAHNGVLAIVAESVSTLLHHAVSARLPPRGLEGLVPQRWRILKALRARDPQAAVAAMDTYARELRAAQSEAVTA